LDHALDDPLRTINSGARVAPASETIVGSIGMSATPSHARRRRLSLALACGFVLSLLIGSGILLDRLWRAKRDQDRADIQERYRPQADAYPHSTPKERYDYLYTLACVRESMENLDDETRFHIGMAVLRTPTLSTVENRLRLQLYPRLRVRDLRFRLAVAEEC